MILNARSRPLVLGFAGVMVATLYGDGRVPAHPKDIKYAKLDYHVPSASQFREMLSNGMVVFIAEDRLLPTFDLVVTFRAGSVVVPDEKLGLAALTGDQMRDGGTRSMKPEELDERVDFLVGSLRIRFSETRGRAALSCMAKDLDEGLAVLIEALRYPRFDKERLRLAKDRRLQNIKRRNDETAGISRIEWGILMDGSNHFRNRYPSSTTLGAITRDAMIEFHRRFIHPGNMIVSVAGDFERAEMLAKLEKAFADWPTGETGSTSFPKPDFTPSPGVYMIDKEGTNTASVAIGHKSIMRGSSDEFPLLVMNGLLGASGPRSRLVGRVWTDEGLAFDNGSRFEQGVYYDGDFQCRFECTSSRCVYATKIVLEEIRRLQIEPVTQDDVDATVAYIVKSFPQRFRTKMHVLNTFVTDEDTGRDPAYWQNFEKNLRRVTPADVHRVARKYLRPDDLVILVVGDTKAIRAGGHNQAPELQFEAFGTVTELPLRDPDTQRR